MEGERFLSRENDWDANLPVAVGRIVVVMTGTQICNDWDANLPVAIIL